MQLVKSSVLAVLVVVLGVAHAAPQNNVSAVTEPVPSVGPVEEKDLETTLPPTRVPIVPSQTPGLEHAPSSQAPIEEKTTKEAATMQSAPEKPASNPPKNENQKGSASSLSQVYPLVLSTAAVVMLSAFSLV